MIQKKLTKEKQNTSIIKLTASLLATLLSLTTVAALCASSSKAVISTPADDNIPLQSNNAATWSPEMFEAIYGTSNPETNSESSTATEQTQQNTEVTITPPSDKPSFMFREFYEDETLVGRHISSDTAIVVSKVQRGDLNFFICDILLASAEALSTAFASGHITGRNYTSSIAKSVGAALAVNGDFCGFRSHGIIIRNKHLYRGAKSAWDLLYLDSYGNLTATNGKNVTADALVSQNVLQSWCFGPTLVNGYEIVDNFNSPDLSKSAYEPRTAIGQISDLHYVIIVADAVRTGTATLGGMTFAQLAQEFKNLNCRVAYNLDGGGSTTLYFKGQVINTPCGRGERHVSDIIYFK